MRGPTRSRSLILLSIALAASNGPTLAAQDTAFGRRPAALCFRGAPANRCTWFTLTEVGLYWRLTDVLPGDEHRMLGAALGVMKNTSDRTAVGGAAFGGGEGEVRGGVALRWRRWLGARSSVDLAAGVHLGGDASSSKIQPGSPMLQAKYTYGVVAASARLDVLRLENICPVASCLTPTGHTSGRFYLGGELGSGPGLGALLGLGMLLVVYAIAYNGS